jgi:hypothetical protein
MTIVTLQSQKRIVILICEYDLTLGGCSTQHRNRCCANFEK